MCESVQHTSKSIAYIVPRTDIRATTLIITNLLYISPSRQLLYVTDTQTSTSEQRGLASHTFEHLSCFLPGLLALGAHTLPLDKLDTLGIDLRALGAKGNFGNAEKGYKTLSNYNLKDLHLWVADGVAQTCWLTYADQPTGLGPDEVVMSTSLTSENGKGYLWIDALEKWKASGSRGVPPGVADKKPVVYSERERLTGSGRGRDYTMKRNAYLLRPEVRMLFFSEQ